MANPTIPSRLPVNLAVLAYFVLCLLVTRFLPAWSRLFIFLGIPFVLLVLLRGRRASLPRPEPRVLSGASAWVHSVSPAEPPAADPEDPESAPDPSARFFTVEVTVTPRPPAEVAGTAWKPALLEVERAEPASDGDDPGIARLEVLDGDAFRDPGWEDRSGPQRLRLLVGVPPDVHELRLDYQGIGFGVITVR